MGDLDAHSLGRVGFIFTTLPWCTLPHGSNVWIYRRSNLGGTLLDTLQEDCIKQLQFIKKMSRFLVIILSIFATPAIYSQSISLEQNIKDLLVDKQANIGVALCKINDTDTISHNGDSRFPMQSVFKFHVALAVLNQVDNGKLSLNQQIKLRKKDMISNTWSPIRDKYPNGGTSISLAEIIEYTVGQSDNIGCDILLRLIGGTQNLEDYLSEIGARDVEVKVNESQMHENWDAQFLNWTTPKSAISLLSDFYTGKVVSPGSRKFLLEVLSGTTTGAVRLKGLLPKGTIVAHKTGTSDTDDQGITAAINDIGIITLPDGSVYAIAAFVTNSKHDSKTNEAIIAEISKLTWEYFSNKN